jgi:membrane-bound lytic murein transglycosylase B
MSARSPSPLPLNQPITCQGLGAGVLLEWVLGTSTLEKRIWALAKVARTWAFLVAMCCAPWVAASPNAQSNAVASPGALQRASKPAKSSHRSKGPKAPKAQAHGDTPEVQALAERIAQTHALPVPWVRRLMAHAVRLDSLSALVLPPATPSAKNWQAYRERFVEPRRIAAGLAFWQQHAQALQRAEQRYGVPAELVVGIIGVETYYGRHMGNFRLIDALSTLALNFPTEHPRHSERRAFFQAELGHFLAQAHQAGPSALNAKGSYAGAAGWPQFMPSSVAQWALDFDENGRIDWVRSPVDAIGSVANYLMSFGWVSGMPTHYPVTPPVEPGPLETLLLPDILPSFSAERMAELGATLDATGQKHVGPMALVELFNGGQEPSYVAGTENFYVVTRYNWSSYYALAVIELGQEIKAARLR